MGFSNTQPYESTISKAQGDEIIRLLEELVANTSGETSSRKMIRKMLEGKVIDESRSEEPE